MLSYKNFILQNKDLKDTFGVINLLNHYKPEDRSKFESSLKKLKRKNGNIKSKEPFFNDFLEKMDEDFKSNRVEEYWNKVQIDINNKATANSQKLFHSQVFHEYMQDAANGKRSIDEVQVSTLMLSFNYFLLILINLA
jgi:hypothetical protein